MKTRWVVTLMVLPVAMLVMVTTCKRSQISRKPPQPIKIEADGEWFCYFPSLHICDSDNDPSGIAGLLLRDGDPIAEENSPLFVYQADDGTVLKLTCEKWNTRLNGKIVSLASTEDDDNIELGREWLEKASAQDLAAMRQIEVSGELDTKYLAALRRLATANPHVAVTGRSNSSLTQVLPLFRPRLLLMVDDFELDASLRSLLADQKQVETLMVKTRSNRLDFLGTLPNLRRLWISDWNIEEAGPLPPGLKQLRSLSIWSSNIKDLAALSAVPPELEELSFEDCSELTDMNGLSRFSGLRTLILNDNEKVIDLSSLGDLRQLQWVGLPQNISQEQFAAFVEAHPNLRILDLTCEKVTDLTPLRKLKKLEGLILGPSFKDFGVLQGLKSLRYVGLHEKTFEKSPDQVAALRKALPETLVVPASTGACLGSGWILLLPPTVVIWKFFQRRRVNGSHHA